MTRELGITLFPYNTPNIPNARTDGTLASIPTGRDVTIDGPHAREPYPKDRGAVRDGGIGNTDVVDCNKVAHTVFTGSF